MDENAQIAASVAFNAALDNDETECRRAFKMLSPQDRLACAETVMDFIDWTVSLLPGFSSHTVEE